MKYFLKGIQAAGVILAWITSAMADGKITVGEMVELVTQLAMIFDIDIVIDLPEEVMIATATVAGDGPDVKGLTAMLAEDTPLRASRHG